MMTLAPSAGMPRSTRGCLAQAAAKFCCTSAARRGAGAACSAIVASLGKNATHRRGARKVQDDRDQARRDVAAIAPRSASETSQADGVMDSPIAKLDSKKDGHHADVGAHAQQTTRPEHHRTRRTPGTGRPRGRPRPRARRYRDGRTSLPIGSREPSHERRPARTRSGRRSRPARRRSIRTGSGRPACS